MVFFKLHFKQNKAFHFPETERCFSSKSEAAVYDTAAKMDS